MSTITPTSDQQQWLNRTTFQVGDTVISSVDGRIGQIIKPDGLVPMFVSPGVVAMVPVASPPMPSATPAQPSTNFVNVKWNDGTMSLVNMSTLQRWQ